MQRLVLQLSNQWWSRPVLMSGPGLKGKLQQSQYQAEPLVTPVLRVIQLLRHEEAGCWWEILRSRVKVP
jgi:hypothetical protein